MKLDVDFLTSLMKQYTYSNTKELDEQGAEDTSSAGGGEQPASSDYPTVTIYNTGVKRGKANPVGNTIWAQGHSVGKANPSGKRDKWTTGLVRGKGNTLL